MFVFDNQSRAIILLALMLMGCILFFFCHSKNTISSSRKQIFQSVKNSGRRDRTLIMNFLYLLVNKRNRFFFLFTFLRLTHDYSPFWQDASM